MSLGSGVIDACAKYYVRGPGPAWSRAWGTVEMMRSALQMTAVDVTDGVAMVHGWYYQADDTRLPSGVVDTRKFWLERWGIAE